MNEKVPAAGFKIERKYVKTATKKHEPVKIIQGSGGGSSCGLYYTTLYYY